MSSCNCQPVNQHTPVPGALSAFAWSVEGGHDQARKLVHCNQKAAHLKSISLHLLQALLQLMAMLPFTLQHAQQCFIVDAQVSNLLLPAAAVSPW